MKDLNVSECDANVISAMLKQNEWQKLELNRMLEKVYGEIQQGMTLAVWGLSFKKDTNDVRDAASLYVIPKLLKKGVKIRAHDPEAEQEFLIEIKKTGINTSELIICDDKYQALEGCDVLLILNDWKVYRQPDFGQLREKIKRKAIFDGKDVLNYAQMLEEGEFEYYSVGRPDIKK